MAIRSLGTRVVLPLEDQGIHPTFSYLVLGAAGRQAVAAIYDLVKEGKASHVTMVDTDPKKGAAALAKLRSLLSPEESARLYLRIIDPRKAEFALLIQDVKEKHGLHVVLSCLPYFLNLQAAKGAIKAGVHYTDLGGHMNTTWKIRDMLDNSARAAGVALITDLGLAPGLCNILAVAGINELDIVKDILIYCGGLPQQPREPWGYQWIFSPEGVIGNYVDPPSVIVLNGQRTEAAPFSMREQIEFEGVGNGRLEAATTEGATATLPWTLEGRIQNIIYRTLRYPGHWDKADWLYMMGWFDKKSIYRSMSRSLSPLRMAKWNLKKHRLSLEDISQENHKFLADLGLLAETTLEFPSTRIQPRAMFVRAAGPHMHHLEPDLVALRVIVSGVKDRVKTELVYDMLDVYDPVTDFMSMARTTGYTAALITALLADQTITGTGHISVEQAVNGLTPKILSALAKRGIHIDINRRTLPPGDVLVGPLSQKPEKSNLAHAA